MKVSLANVLEQLSVEENCCGALFTSYTFDASFFEEHVLRTVLRLTSDPVEHAERFHFEARRALQEVPVIAIVDAGERGAGRRLPFDLLTVSATVFHPKCVLLLYQTFARLLVGSGNLTRSGFGGNTELFCRVDLDYSSPHDAVLLRGFDEHLVRISSLIRQPGTQLDIFRKELTRRTRRHTPNKDECRYALLDSTASPIMDQLLALLPPDATIESIGMLAPFFERDIDGELDVTSVIGALVQKSGSKPHLDIGVAWENAQLQPSNDSVLKEGLERVWTWRRQNDGDISLHHMVFNGITANSVVGVDDTGARRRWPLADVTAAIAARELWVQPQAIAYAPRKAVAAARKSFSNVRLWLHPASRFEKRRPMHRPLHAKLLVISYRNGVASETLIILGSPNMSRRALLMPADHGKGNVEVAMALRVPGTLSIRQLLPGLVHVPDSACELMEREFPAQTRNHSLAIECAEHDPALSTLVVKWSAEARHLQDWELSYNKQELSRGATAPSEPVRVEGFVLSPATAEVVLRVNNEEFSVPILVTDLIALPAANALKPPGLAELLLFLSQRIGIEQIGGADREPKNESDDNDELTAIFGEGLSATDVFRAWWSATKELCDGELSIQGFRVRLDGALGIGAAWNAMLRAETHFFSREQKWFYGAELLRELRVVHPKSEEGLEDKMRCLATLCDRIRKDLDSLALDTRTSPWMSQIASFYGLAGT